MLLETETSLPVRLKSICFIEQKRYSTQSHQNKLINKINNRWKVTVAHPRGDSSSTVTVELKIRNVGFWGEGKTGVPGEEPLGAKTRTNYNKLNPHLMLNRNWTGPHWWVPFLLPRDGAPGNISRCFMDFQALVCYHHRNFVKQSSFFRLGLLIKINTLFLS